MPRESLLVLGVDAASLDQLGSELLEGLLIVLGVEVNDNCVDHFELNRCGYDGLVVLVVVEEGLRVY